MLWDARALYVGPALGLGAHRNAVAVVAVGLDAPFGVARDPRARAPAALADARECRTALIPPRTLHRLHPGPGRLAFLYLDALDANLPLATARAGAREYDGEMLRAAYDLADESTLVTLLDDAATGRLPWAAACAGLRAWLGPRPGAAPAADHAVASAVRRMRADPAGCPSLAALAAAADLSPSRFAHRFTTAVGIPFRRYRTWCRMAAVARSAAGGSLTRAALDAGFASSAHLSAAFRAMFGLTPTQLGFGASPRGRLALVEVDAGAA